MNYYAQVQNGLVRAIGSSAPDSTWIPCGNSVEEGWLFDGSSFSPVISRSEVPVPTAIQSFVESAWRAMIEADNTMHRIQEGVSLGFTTWTTADVVTWVNYRRSLRSLMNATTVQVLPIKPPYPAGT
jgi:hypothetical protein